MQDPASSAVSGAAPAGVRDGVLAALARLLGPEGFSRDPVTCGLAGQDVFRSGPPVLAVLRPDRLDTLTETVRLCAAAGLPLVPRGGGLSYTDGVVAPHGDCLALDLRRLDRIVAIDPEDMTVTVEAGVTWKALRDALAAQGLRTPYWGPMSGLQATVGGALSQGSIFFGSARHGAVGDSVLSLTVVTGSGAVLETGAAASQHVERPAFRWYGPDLTGLFLGDCGALGIKAQATFRLLRLEPAQEFLSFAFATWADLAAAIGAIGREGLCSEVAAFDPYLAGLRLKRASLMADVAALGALTRARTGFVSGIVDAARVALAGRRYMDGAGWSLHCTLDGLSDAALKPAVARLRGLATACGGREIAASIGRMLRATPFPPPNSMLGPGGERWVPVHGIVPHTKLAAAMNACEAVFAEHAAECARHGITHGYLLSAVATHAVLIEPCLYWRDARLPLHAERMEADYLRRLPEHAADPEATAAVALLKAALARTLTELGASHFQLGRFYPYAESLTPASLAALQALKRQLDPQGILNPGVLGIG